jgi:hypothetical protein
MTEAPNFSAPSGGVGTFYLTADSLTTNRKSFDGTDGKVKQTAKWTRQDERRLARRVRRGEADIADVPFELRMKHRLFYQNAFIRYVNIHIYGTDSENDLPKRRCAADYYDFSIINNFRVNPFLLAWASRKNQNNRSP